MKEFRVFYIVLIIISAVMSFIYQSRLMPVILIVLLLCPFFGFAVLLVNRFALKVSISPNELITEKHEDGLIKVTLKNRFFFPISPVRLTGVFQGAEERGISDKILQTDVAPFTSVILNLPFSMPYRGEYVIYLDRAEFFDIFKLFRISKKLNLSVNIMVLPREIHLEGTNGLNEGESENMRGLFSPLNKDVFSSLREYREGDSLKHIHWKLSAKQDNLIVKQMEQSVNNSASVFCDFAEYPEFEAVIKANILNNTRKRKRKNYSEREKENVKTSVSHAPEKGETLLKVTDNVIEAALAIARRIVLGNDSVKVCWQSGSKVGIEEHIAENYNSFGELFCKLALLRAGEVRKPFKELLDYYGKESYGKTIYIITPVLSKNLLETIETSGFAGKRETVLVLLDYMNNPPDLVDYVINETNISVKLINEKNIAAELS